MDDKELKEFLEYKEEYDKKYPMYFDYFNEIGCYFGLYGHPTIVNYIKWMLFCHNVVTDLSHQIAGKPIMFHCFIGDKVISMPEKEVWEIIDRVTEITIRKDAWEYEETKSDRWDRYRLKHLRPECGGDIIHDFVADIVNQLL